MLRRSRSEKLITLGAFLRARCKSLHAAFAAFDTQNTGMIRFEAFERGLSRLGSKEHAFLVWPLLDPNQAGYVSLESFLAVLGEYSDALNVGSVPPIPEFDFDGSKEIGIKPWEQSRQRTLQCATPETESKHVCNDAIHEFQVMQQDGDTRNEENPEVTTEAWNSNGMTGFDGKWVMDALASNHSKRILPDVDTETLATLVSAIEVLEARISSLRADMDSARIEWRAELTEAISEERNRANTQLMNLAQKENGLHQASGPPWQKGTSASSTDSRETVAPSSSEAASYELTQSLTNLEARVDSVIAECRKQHLHVESLEAHTKMEVEDLRGKLYSTGTCHAEMEKIKSELDEGFKKARMQTHDEILSTSKELVKQFEERVLAVVQRMVSTVMCNEPSQRMYSVRQRSASPVKPTEPYIPLSASRRSLSKSNVACMPLGKATIAPMSPRGMVSRLSSAPANGWIVERLPSGSLPSTPRAQLSKAMHRTPVHIATLK